ncbi:MAG: sodium:proton antiporter [Thermodesulfobacteriota bacterium]|jgi:Na+/H+ antiporter NhaD/arsenite permease-like protein|nr:MAG: sodium:proton antiporter [Thermodesulfobacteriota bacterium]
MKKISVSFFILIFTLGLFIGGSWAGSSSSPSGNEATATANQCPVKFDKHCDELGKKLPLWTILPFVGILLSIAIFPLVAPHFWHHHYPKVAAFWALIFALPFIYFYNSDAIHNILHIYMVDYIPFIIMLWALFTIAGGIVLTGNLQGRPIVNTILLLVGTVMASWVGTTGASMIMIRPVLRANASRRRKTHVICFFIFLVANIGGSLTPLGDPPLFLGFLHGVPFFWTFKLLPEMLFASSLLLIIFFLVDSFYYQQETHKENGKTNAEKSPIGLKGWHNFFFLAGVVGAILLSGILKWGAITIFGISIPKQNLFRDFMMILMGVLSLLTTQKNLRETNEFSWEPIKEVAYLFAGIFMTIIPALSILNAGSEGTFAFLVNAVNEPYHYYWISGGLSSFLDNAPTYLIFFKSALGKLQIPESLVRQILLCGGSDSISKEFISFLKAISIGSVFMGANTYIGNAPNFMVKSIAEEAGVAMPSFFGYIFKYSIPILIPLFIVVTFVFF